MGQNSDLRDRAERFRRRLYRSRHGKLLGVFTGIAESLGYPPRRTRFIGIALLGVLAMGMGADGLWISVLVGGFFYMLLALLMQPPRTAGYSTTAAADTEEDDFTPPPRWTQPAPSGYAGGTSGGRVDLAQIDRQLDSLNRRIQRMETIVTDKQYDWERRMDS